MSVRLDNTIPGDLDLAANKPSKITVDNDRLKAQGKIHAYAIAFIPSFATIVAVAIAWKTGISAVDLGLLVSTYILGIIGIEVGFHRYFAHNAFQASKGVKIALAILGSSAAQGSINYWISNHRRHHQYSDKSGDLHSPYIREDAPLTGLKGLWHAHIGWIFDHELTNTNTYAKDMIRDSLIVQLNKTYLWWILLGLVVPALLGGVLTGTWMGIISGFWWGGLVRLFLVQQGTFIVNSICHVYGNRPFSTSDRSTNNIWLAIPSLGGSWHNNHHAFPYTAVNGLNWWQIDLCGWFIRGLERLGLVWDVRVPSSEAIQMKKNAAIDPVV